MFRTSINETPFTTEGANIYFDNIVGENWNSDSTFLSTLRALIAPRIPEGESIHLMFGGSSYSADTINGISDEGVITHCFSGINFALNGLIYIHSFRSSSESNIENMNAAKRAIKNVFPKFVQLPAITAFYKKAFNVDCYINVESKSVIVLVDNMDNAKLHYLQVSILAMLPWYFDKSAGITEQEMNLTKSLRERTQDNYMQILSEMASKYDFNSAKVRKLLDGFETKFEQVELDMSKQRLDTIGREIDTLYSRVTELLTKRNNECIRYAGLERRIAEKKEGDSEIMEYFLCNKKLYLEAVERSTLYFAVKDYLSYFDREMAESVIKNKSSVAYRFNGASYNKEKVEKLLRELFVSDDPQLRIKICAAYRLDIGSGISCQTSHAFGPDFNDAIPNAHINRYNCLGDNVRVINEMITEGNYIVALEQCVSSCKSLNFSDGIVLEDFFGTFYAGHSGNNRCIELPDGRVVTPKDAIAWMDEQEGASDGEKTKKEVE